MQSFTIEQARAARAVLGWSHADLGEAAGLSLATIRNFELGRQATATATIAAIRKAFGKAGVEFRTCGDRIGLAVTIRRQPWQGQQ